MNLTRLLLPTAALLALVGALTMASAQTRALAPPQRNLLVELRESEAGALDATHAAAEGGVVIHSDGRVSGRAVASVEARSIRREGQGSQQVLVLNGGRASLHVGVSVPMQ